jgi:alkanesulfonate monooxygenase SsuD/methylene tetrahydromethanopterin reductase-like flavin-dependent oxidoreductase (luciferase family)
VSFAGRHYRMRGAKFGPLPAHDIGIGLGAYGRMMRVVGRLADGPVEGWLRGPAEYWISELGARGTPTTASMGSWCGATAT